MPLKLYVTGISPLCDEKLFWKLYEKLPPHVKEKTDSKKLKTNKMQTLGAYALLEYALDKEGIDMQKAEITVNEYGKPYLINENICFNLSHSENYAICAVSDNPVGCDVEMIRANTNTEIAKRFFCRKEYRYLSSIRDSAEKDKAFILMWTLKESYIKAIGKGLSAKLNDFNLDISNNKRSFTQMIDNKIYHFKCFELRDAFISVCSENSDMPELPAFIHIIDCLK
ncbi:MAG: 4'-phosphopantetheinyl transferase superfamily protein [Clostridiales bacterium]|nr:4'-phosphopantetheinyl transferase superfamily protein [Clostridiales bacterium]